MSEENILNVLNRMTTNLDENIKIIEGEFGDIKFSDTYFDNLLHIFLRTKNNESKTILAIKSLLRAGLDPNSIDFHGCNFIQTALYTGYSENFIIELIQNSLCVKSKPLDVNSKDYDGNTILHSAILSNEYKDEIINIYMLLCKHGYDSKIENYYNEDLMTVLQYAYNKMNKFSIEQVKRFKTVYDEKTNNESSKNNFDINEENNMGEVKMFEDEKATITKEEREKINGLCKILNEKTYDSRPTIGRDIEIDRIRKGLASLKKSPLIVGPSGCGKTSLVDELVYRIINEEETGFLKDRLIVEANSSILVSGTKYAGTFEEKVKTLMEFCIKHNAILFIDEIHTIFGAGTHNKSNVDLADMLKYYIDRYDIKIIGITTEEGYNEYLANETFKRNFKLIKIEEPDENTLYDIIEKTIIDYGRKTKVNPSEVLNDFRIIDNLIELTSKKNRVQGDNINNPDLVISIIDDAFSNAIIANRDYLKKEDIISALNECDRIYNSSRERIIKKVKSDEIINNEIKVKNKVLKVDFGKKI